jgi:hypothetical protein
MQQYDVILLGGLSGRLDQTVHTLSYLQKLRKIRERVFAITDENIGWVLQEVCDLSARHALPFAQALCRVSISFTLTIPSSARRVASFPLGSTSPFSRRRG